MFLWACHAVSAQEITMFSVISISQSDIKKSGAYLLENKWKFIKTAKADAKELQDPHGKYAHFTNCFFMTPEYKGKFAFDAHNNADGVFRDVYVKNQDSIFLYYYLVKQSVYPAGVLYKANRVKLDKIIAYLQHNNYAQTFARDSITIFEIKHSVENVTIDKTNSPLIEYYIDRCWKYADHNRID